LPDGQIALQENRIADARRAYQEVLEFLPDMTQLPIMAWPWQPICLKTGQKPNHITGRHCVDVPVMPIYFAILDIRTCCRTDTVKRQAT
jgi:hypothetical protein